MELSSRVLPLPALHELVLLTYGHAPIFPLSIEELPDVVVVLAKLIYLVVVVVLKNTYLSRACVQLTHSQATSLPSHRPTSTQVSWHCTPVILLLLSWCTDLDVHPPEPGLR